jgi:hypothetical protein
MKKYFLFILSFFIWLTIPASGNNKNSFAGYDDVLNHSVSSVNYSHTELKGSKYFVSLAGNCRQHNCLNFIVADQFKNSNAYCFLKTNNRYLATFPSKKYLLHIYPSHNFW